MLSASWARSTRWRSRCDRAAAVTTRRLIGGSADDLWNLAGSVEPKLPPVEAPDLAAIQSTDCPCTAPACSDTPVPAPVSDSISASSASNHGTVTILEWWSDSGTALFHYTDGRVLKCPMTHAKALDKAVRLIGTGREPEVLMDGLGLEWTGTSPAS